MGYIFRNAKILIGNAYIHSPTRNNFTSPTKKNFKMLNPETAPATTQMVVLLTRRVVVFSTTTIFQRLEDGKGRKRKEGRNFGGAPIPTIFLTPASAHMRAAKESVSHNNNNHNNNRKKGLLHRLCTEGERERDETARLLRPPVGVIMRGRRSGDRREASK